MPSSLSWLKRGVTSGSPPNAPMTFAEKLSKIMTNTWGRVSFRSWSESACVGAGKHSAKRASASSSGYALNWEAKSSDLERDANKLKQGLMAAWFKNWFVLK